jgi:hypothetical protein
MSARRKIYDACVNSRLAGVSRCGMLGRALLDERRDTQRRFRMSLQGHIVELQRRHEALEKEIEKEKLHRNANEAKIVEMKRKKLHIKDELAKLQVSETRH